MPVTEEGFKLPSATSIQNPSPIPKRKQVTPPFPDTTVSYQLTNGYIDILPGCMLAFLHNNDLTR
jgi:hypothetical protein